MRYGPGPRCDAHLAPSCPADYRVRKGVGATGEDGFGSVTDGPRSRLPRVRDGTRGWVKTDLLRKSTTCHPRVWGLGFGSRPQWETWVGTVL